MPDILPGLYADMDAATYFADPCPVPSLTQSIAKILIDKAPRHAWVKHPRLNPNWKSDEGDYTKARAVGNAVHRLLIGRGKDLGVIDFDDFRTNAAKAAKEAMVAEGRTPILRKHHDLAQTIMAEAGEQLAEGGYANDIGAGNGEVVMVAKDGGVWLRSMCDWMTSLTLLYDFKTGETSAAPQTIPGRLESQGWHIQAAMQERILDIIDPANIGNRVFRFIAIEDDEPFAITVNEMTESAMEMGRRQLQYAIDLWSDCMRRNEWPRYPLAPQRPEFPAYAETKWLNREVSEAAAGRWPMEWAAPLPVHAE